MQIQLEHPAFLWIVVAALPLLIWAAFKSYAIASRRVRIASFLIRFVALTFVVLALCRPVWRHTTDKEAVVFAFDVSDSLEHDALQKGVDFVTAATRELAPDQQASLVIFGGRPKVVRQPSNEPIYFGRTADDGAGTGSNGGADGESNDHADTEIADAVFHRERKKAAQEERQAVERDLSGDGAQEKLAKLRERIGTLEAVEKELVTTETDVREALRLARSVLPEDARRRVVLLTDGNWTRNDPGRELEFLKEAGVSVDTVELASVRPKEVIAERLIAPSHARIREPVELEVQVDSAEKRDVTMRLYRDGFLLKEDPISLEAGDNVIRIPKQELEEGFHEFEVKIDAPGDPRPENNTARAVVVVEGRPRVLMIEGQERDSRYLEAALHDEDIVVEVRPPVGFPSDLNDLLSYDLLILSDVSATEVHSSQLELVKRYVKDFGGGLIMIGGEHSFGLGGYYRTPVEDALPVRMPIKKTIEKPSFALVLVIDRSGSMAGEKLALAKEAAIASAELLKKKDMIGVVVFDEKADWVVELQPAGNREEVVSQVSRVMEGGGTYIYAGLYYAYRALSECNAKLKHCIVLTDGHTTGTREEHIDIVQRMAAESITVSTVGIGDADQALLSAMAQAGEGESYFTNDFGNIPQIFTKETLRASKSMLVEEPFVPVPTGVDDQMLRGVELADAPILLGYVSTTPKERAKVLLVSEYGDPILAEWNYGLGRSAAFTSDAKNRWASDWISWPQFGKFWSQVVRSVMSRGTTSALQQTADVRLDRGKVDVRIDNRDREGRFIDEAKPELSIVAASGDTKPVPVSHTAPGEFEASFPLESYGEFVRLRVETRLDDQLVGLLRYAVIESYPPEYRAAAPDAEFLERVATATGGRQAPEPGAAMAFDTPPARGLEDLWRLCVLAAALLLPLDIALRRLT